MKSIKLVFIVAVAHIAALLAVTVDAVPANPQVRTLEQPSGFQFDAHPRGDERILWFETVDTQEVLVFNKRLMRYEYAEIDVDDSGYSLQPSGLPYGSYSFFRIPEVANQDLMQAWQDAWEKNSNDHSHEVSAEGVAGHTGVHAETEMQSALGGAPLGAGSYLYNTLFIMIEFNDFQFVDNEAVWSDKTFGGYPGNINSTSLNAYYQEVSRGQLFFTQGNEAQGSVNDGFVKVHLDMNHPHHARNFSAWQSVLDQAFDAASSYVDFSQFDANQNGVVDKTELVVAFVVAGRESSYTGSETEGFWGHAYFSHDFGHYDGVNISTGYMGFGERQGPVEAPYNSTLGVIAHELGHSAFNLRDLYNQPSDISHWGLMGVGCWGHKPGELIGERPVHFTAYTKSRIYLQGGRVGFFDPIEISPSADAQLITTTHPFSAGSYDYFRVPGENSGQYWYIEQRKVQGFDEGLMGDGLQEGDTGVLVSYAQSSSRLWIRRMSGETSGTRQTDMMYAGNVTTFSPDSTPINSSYPNTNNFSGLIIDQVSAPGDQMTAYVSKELYPCQSYTATLPNHQTAGRTYYVEEGSFWKVKRYYAIGSNEDLGTSTWGQVTLSETGPSYYTTSECPVGGSDTTAPVITLTGGETTIAQGGTWVDPGFTANDDVDGDISHQVTISGSVNTNVQGDYTLRYNVSDAAGNAAIERTRLVHVSAATGCVEHSASVTGHIDAGRAVTCGSFGFDGCAVGSGTNIGPIFLSTAVVLKETPAGYFDLGSCD
ncbi:MAG: M6 family metalloprotease domain-containing protein [Agarilytica sp.]